MTTLAIVGAAHIHTPGFVKRLKERTDVKVKYVYDHDEERAKFRANELGAAVELKLKNVLSDPEVSGVLVCSETNLHEKLVSKVAKAKKHMFVEKPLGMGAKDSYAMLKAIEKAGVIFQTGFFMRSDAKFIFLKEQITKGNFGMITRVRHSNCHSGSLGGWFDKKPTSHDNWRWMADVKQAGVGAYGDLGAHSMDVLLWLMGEVERATGVIELGTERYKNCDEFGEGILKFKNGAVGTLAAAWLDIENPVSLIVSGTEGHASIIHSKLYFKSTKAKEFDGKEVTMLPPALPGALDLFIDSVKSGKAHPAMLTAKECAVRCATMEAVYEGARKQKWIKPKKK